MFKLFIHPKIYTLDPVKPIAKWFLTLDKKIILTGFNEPIPDLGIEIEECRLPGEIVVPGFIDAHCHFGRYLRYSINSLSPNEKIKLRLPSHLMHWLDLSSIKSAAQLLEKIREKSYILSPGTWIVGGGWSGLDRIPEMEELNLASPQNPLFLFEISLHSGIGNSLALKIAGIDENTWSPAGGRIGRCKLTGELTGILYEKAVNLVDNVIPEKLSNYAMENLAILAMKKLNSLGIVGLHDMEHTTKYDIYPCLAQLLAKSPELFTIRFITSLLPENIQENLKCGRISNFGNDYLKTFALKLIYDGSLGAKTALMNNPYIIDDKLSNYYGEELTPRGEMLAIAREASLRGIPLAIHAIGDQAVRIVTELFEEISESNKCKFPKIGRASCRERV